MDNLIRSTVIRLVRSYLLTTTVCQLHGGLSLVIIRRGTPIQLCFLDTALQVDAGLIMALARHYVA